MTRSRTVWSPISKAAFLSLFIALPGTTIFSERLTPERLWELGRLSDPQGSPDGQRVVYGVSFYDIGKNQGDRDLYVISSRGGEPRRITAFQGNEFNARWRPRRTPYRLSVRGKRLGPAMGDESGWIGQVAGHRHRGRNL